MSESQIHETHKMLGSAGFGRMCQKCASCTCHDSAKLENECEPMGKVRR